MDHPVLQSKTIADAGGLNRTSLQKNGYGTPTYTKVTSKRDLPLPPPPQRQKSSGSLERHSRQNKKETSSPTKSQGGEHHSHHHHHHHNPHRHHQGMYYAVPQKVADFKFEGFCSLPNIYTLLRLLGAKKLRMLGAQNFLLPVQIFIEICDLSRST